MKFKLSEGKEPLENKEEPNKSMDVRAKQRLSYNDSSETLACVYSVSPHVISAVRHLSLIGAKDMKTFQQLFFSLFLIALSLCLNSLVFAQKATLPSGLTKDSSLEEILNWLDKTNLPQAHIGLEANVQEPEADEIITTATRYYEWAFFSKGFRLAKIDGCKVTLRNDNVELIRFETKYPNPAEGSLDEFRKIQNSQSQFTGEIFIPLQDLKANKSPYQHTKKAAKAALLGTWRTEFKLKSKGSLFSLFPVIWSKEKAKEKIEEFRENAMRVEIIKTERNEQNEVV